MEGIFCLHDKTLLVESQPGHLIQKREIDFFTCLNRRRKLHPKGDHGYRIRFWGVTLRGGLQEGSFLKCGTGWQEEGKEEQQGKEEVSFHQLNTRQTKQTYLLAWYKRIC